MNYLLPGDMPFRSVDPSRGEAFATFSMHGDAQIEAALGDSISAWTWAKGLTVAARADLLHKFADRLDAALEALATLITREMGKPISEARGEVRKCAASCRYLADKAEDWLAPETIQSPARSSAIHFDSLGPILAVMPWNFPLWQIVRFFAPAFLVGNVTIIKHAENVPSTAEAVERLFLEAGFAKGAVINLRIGHEAVGRLIADSRIRAVTVTGSVRAGRAIGAHAGQWGKPAVMELGGSDPFIVFADASFDDAVRAAVAARFANSGQSCVCAKRFLVEKSIADRFIEGFVAQTQRLQVGDPLQNDCAIGPMARRDLRDGLERQLARAVSEGAQTVLAGGTIDGPGNYFAPTVLTDFGLDNTAFREELFGPVAPIATFDTEDDCIRTANATEYGLAAAIWTLDEARASRMERALEAGAVFVNDIVRSDPSISFGGTKASGYGRELGRLGVRQFANAKTIWRG